MYLFISVVTLVAHWSVSQWPAASGGTTVHIAIDAQTTTVELYTCL